MKSYPYNVFFLIVIFYGFCFCQLRTVNNWTISGGRSPAVGPQFTFKVTKNGIIRIGLSSNVCDPYLYLLDNNGMIIAENNDGGPGTNAVIEQALILNNSPYTIVSTTFNHGAQGTYTLTVDGITGLVDSLQKATIFSSKWEQNEFIIGTFISPRLTGNATTDNNELVKFKHAGFNFMCGFSPYSNVNHLDWQKYNSSAKRQVSNVYRLQRLQDIGGIKTLAHDDTRHSWYTSQAIPQQITHYKYDLIKNIDSDLRNYLYGYYLMDEPKGTFHFTNQVALLPKIAYYASHDPSLLPWVNLLAAMPSVWKSWDSYKQYVQTFTQNPHTRMVSFDYYVIRKNGKGRIGYMRMGNEVNYYRHLDLYASEAKRANMVFWGVPQCQETSAEPFPDEKNLRYNAFSFIIYGAKAIIWFNYQLPDIESYIKAPSNNDTIYDNISLVNKELLTMGPLLLNLNWLTTIHGSAIDPRSKESGLPTTDTITNIKIVKSNNSKYFAVGILRGKDSFLYLLLFNKDIHESRGRDITIARDKKYTPLLFNKNNGNWQKHSSYQTNTVSVSVKPGDMQMLKLSDF